MTGHIVGFVGDGDGGMPEGPLGRKWEVWSRS